MPDWMNKIPVITSRYINIFAAANCSKKSTEFQRKRDPIPIDIQAYTGMLGSVIEKLDRGLLIY